LVAICALCAVVVSACGLGEKQRYADTIISSAEVAREAGTAVGTFSVDFTVVDFTPTLVEGAGAVGGGLSVGQEAEVEELKNFDFPEVRFPVEIDLDAGRARLLFPTVDTGELAPLVIFSGTTAWVRRSSTVGSARPWAKLDFARLDEENNRRRGEELLEALGIPAVAGINPVIFLELLSGTLAGSVEVIGPEDLEGGAATVYEANVSRDKVKRELDFSDDELESRQNLFRSLSIRQSIHESRFWLSDDGRPRRVEVTMQQAAGRKSRFDVKLTLDLEQFGTGSPIEVPASDDTVLLDGWATYASLVLGSIREVAEAQQAAQPQPAAPEAPADPAAGGGDG